VSALIAVLTVLALIAVAAATPSTATDPGSRSAGKPGTLALYTWLSELGFSTTRLSGQFDLSSMDVLVINEPTTDFSDDDMGAVSAFVRGGGEVILASDSEGMMYSGPLMTKLGISTTNGAHASGTGRVVEPLDDLGDAHDIPIGTGPSFRDDPEVAPLVALDSTAVVVEKTTGGGGPVFVIGSSVPLSNDGLRRLDTGPLVLAMLERARGVRVAFDEFHHGEIAEPGAGDIIYSPVGLAGLLLALVIVVSLAITGRRVGRAIPAGDPGRVPSAGEYIAAMAALIERSQHRGGVADRYADELKRRIAAVAGGDARLSDPEFVATLQGYPPEQTAAVGMALARARDLAGSRPSEETLLQLARHIDALEHVWRGQIDAEAVTMRA